MTDDQDRSPWAPPGAGDAGDGVSESTVAFSTEPTQRIAREEPPPPPPPPAAAWSPPPPGGVTYGAGGWQPPPRPRRRTGLVVAIVAVVVLLVGALGVGAVLLVRVVDVGRIEPIVGQEAVPAPDVDRPDPQAVPADDVVAQTEAVLEAINASEERMIAFQETVAGALDEDGTVGDGAGEIARAAQDAGDDLTAMRSDLRALGGGDSDGFDRVRDIRDTYAAHMQAWIDYVDAVAGSPTLASPDSSDAGAFWDEIASSGDDFVAAVAGGLPEGVPTRLDELARFIVERGFGGFGQGPSGDVA